MEKKRTGMKITISLMSLIIVILIILLLLCRCGAGTDEVCSGCGRTDAHGVITSGSVDISLVEHTLVDGELEPYNAATAAVMPGTELSRIVTVRNHDKESFIRARVELTVRDAQGKKMDLSPEELAEVIVLDINDDRWISKNGDNLWLYHDAVVGTDEETSELFTTVSFDIVAMDNAYQNCTIEIDVYAQAVQAANNGEDVLAAAGWPQE